MLQYMHESNNMTSQVTLCRVIVYCKSHIFFLLIQGLQNGFFNFETFDVEEYEHYEVRCLNLTILVKIF